MEAYQIAFIVAFVLGIAELMTGAFIFLGMAIGAFVVAILQWVTMSFNDNRDLVTFAIVSTVAFVASRKIFAKSADLTEAKDDVNQY